MNEVTKNIAAVSEVAYNQFLKKTGLDMEAVKVRIPNSLTGKDSDFYGVHNAKTGKMLNCVSEIYEVVQYREAFEAIRQISRLREISLASGGVWAGGAEGYAQIDIGEFFVGKKNNGDRVTKRLTFITSHNSRLNFSILLTPYRLFCKNQLPSVNSLSANEKKVGMKTSLRFKHTARGRARIERLPEVLRVVDGQFEYTQEVYNKLESIKIIDKDAVSEILSRLFPMSNSERQRTMTTNAIGRIMARLNDGDGGRTPSNTGWGLWQAIQGMHQHAPIKKTESHERSVLMGTVCEKSLDAMNTIFQVCSSQAVGILAPDDEISRIISGIEGMEI